jgi:hypothetical protein
MGVPRKLTLTLAALMIAQSLAGLMAPEQYRDVDCAGGSSIVTPLTTKHARSGHCQRPSLGAERRDRIDARGTTSGLGPRGECNRR